MPLDGIFNINKPEDETSFSTVQNIRHLASEKRAGHMGTLDPFAQGVLPIFLGKGTGILTDRGGASQFERVWASRISAKRTT